MQSLRICFFRMRTIRIRVDRMPYGHHEIRAARKGDISALNCLEVILCRVQPTAIQVVSAVNWSLTRSSQHTAWLMHDRVGLVPVSTSKVRFGGRNKTT